MTDWLTPAQVAAKLPARRGGTKHVVTVRKALESGELHGHQPSGRRGHWSVSAEAVDAWIQGIDGVTACGCRPKLRRVA